MSLYIIRPGVLRGVDVSSYREGADRWTETSESSRTQRITLYSFHCEAVCWLVCWFVGWLVIWLVG